MTFELPTKVHQRRLDHHVELIVEGSSRPFRLRRTMWWPGNWRFSYALIFLFFCALLLYAFLSSPSKKRRTFSNGQQPIANTRTLEFWTKSLHLDLNSYQCDDLYKGADVSMPAEYEEQKRLLNDKLAQILNEHKLRKPDRSIVDVPVQQRLYYDLVNQHFVSNVCETGFSAGQSTLLYMMAHTNIRVFSFDDSRRLYTTAMVEYIHREFPGRLLMVSGNSKESIPHIRPKLPTHCDFISIDGGREYDVVLSDLNNLKLMSNQDRNLVIVNHSPGYDSVEKAWTTAIAKGDVEPIYSCRTIAIDDAPDVPSRGFSIGRFINFEEREQNL